MTDEDTPNSKNINSENSPDVADKNGQMLVIYLPEGSVIVDRSDVNLSSAPTAIVEHIAPKIEEKAVEPVVERAPVQQMQPTLAEVVQLAVAEILRIQGGSIGQNQKENSLVMTTTNSEEVGAQAFADYPAPALKKSVPEVLTAPAGARRVHVQRRHKRNWVHGINTFLVVYMLLVAIVPGVLSSAFGLEIYASKVAHPAVLISQGDLLVSRILPASQVKVSDVLLVRDGNSWRLDAREVTSNSSTGGISTVVTASTGGVAIDKTYVLASNSDVYMVSRVIPKLGYIPIVLSSVMAKVLGGLFILILNITVHYRRSRRRRLVTAIH